MGGRIRKLRFRFAEARSTALFQLATGLPAAVLARTLGIGIDIAVTCQRDTAAGSLFGRAMMTSSAKASSNAGEHGSPEFPQREQAIILITGIQASGKSTVAQALAERLPRSVHVRGDQFRRMVVNGRSDMTATPSDEAVRQLRLRHQLTARTSDDYFRAGFTVVVQDVILGEHLARTVAQFRGAPLLVVVLAPEPGAVLEREAGRTKNAYDTLSVHMLDKVLREETAQLGLWIDTSFQTPAETVDEILARAWTEARIGEPTA
ncbi:AAA family ATPase [Streptomyces sp. NPDC051561]|uniref:AAA family ATPase n=1 Tax=Streptomyces sp. NPDC051561 TaxID=3365658 RepID=UPI0037A11AD7